jgi:hypothetical protein
VRDPLLTTTRPVVRRPPPRPTPADVAPAVRAPGDDPLVRTAVPVDLATAPDDAPTLVPSDPITAPNPVVTVVDRAPTVDAPIVPATTAVPAVVPVLVPAVPDEPAPKPRPAPTVPRVSRRIRWRARRPRVRKVSRVVRRVDPWTVFKISVVFWLLAYVVLLVAGVLLWNLAVTTGTIGNVEGFVKDLFGLETFTFDGQKIFRASWLLGAIFAVAGTGLSLVAAVMFNLIADLVGGLRITVLEEEVVLRERPFPGPHGRQRG